MVISDEIMCELKKHVKEGERFKLKWLKTKMSPAPKIKQLLADARFTKCIGSTFKLKETTKPNNFDPWRTNEKHNNRDYRKLEM